MLTELQSMTGAKAAVVLGTAGVVTANATEGPLAGWANLSAVAVLGVALYFLIAHFGKALKDLTAAQHDSADKIVNKLDEHQEKFTDLLMHQIKKADSAEFPPGSFREDRR